MLYATAVAAMQNGEIDAISNLEPVISTLDRDGMIEVIRGLFTHYVDGVQPKKFD